MRYHGISSYGWLAACCIGLPKLHSGAYHKPDQPVRRQSCRIKKVISTFVCFVLASSTTTPFIVERSVGVTFRPCHNKYNIQCTYVACIKSQKGNAEPRTIIDIHRISPVSWSNGMRGKQGCESRGPLDSWWPTILSTSWALWSWDQEDPSGRERAELALNGQVDSGDGGGLNVHIMYEDLVMDLAKWSSE